MIDIKRKKFRLSGKMIDSDKAKFNRFLKEGGSDYYTGRRLTSDEIAYRKGFIDGFIGGKYDRFEKMNNYTYKRFR